jgi:hypothetical protein
VKEAAKHGISKVTVKRARAKLNGKAPTKTIGLSKQRPKNEAIPLGVKRAPQRQAVVLPCQRAVQAAISQARQVASAAAIRTYVLTLLEQESVAS